LVVIDNYMDIIASDVDRGGRFAGVEEGGRIAGDDHLLPHAD
jgi:hypothetical protein